LMSSIGLFSAEDRSSVQILSFAPSFLILMVGQDQNLSCPGFFISFLARPLSHYGPPTPSVFSRRLDNERSHIPTFFPPVVTLPFPPFAFACVFVFFFFPLFVSLGSFLQEKPNVAQPLLPPPPTHTIMVDVSSPFPPLWRVMFQAVFCLPSNGDPPLFPSALNHSPFQNFSILYQGFRFFLPFFFSRTKSLFFFGPPPLRPTFIQCLDKPPDPYCGFSDFLLFPLAGRHLVLAKNRFFSPLVQGVRVYNQPTPNPP